MLVLQNITYIHSNKDVLFDNIHVTINRHDKIALIGNNGCGKSTLLQLITGLLIPTAGVVIRDACPYYIPQILGQFNQHTIAEALQVDKKLTALKQILNGDVTNVNLEIIGDDWSIEEQCYNALAYWKLNEVDLMQKMDTLSGGEKTKVFLAAIAIHTPEVILMDEPSNHLDIESRNLLYDFIRTTSATLVVVSHDRSLLNLLDSVCELSAKEITVYGGNYDFYSEQKKIETNALHIDLQNKTKALRKAKEVERETMERQQKLDARGKKKQEKAGLPTISMKTFKNNAEKSTARTRDVHAEKIQSVALELDQLRNELSDRDKIKFNFNPSVLHKGKVLISAKEINISVGQKRLWKQNVSLDITSGERIAIKGKNGAGKTTLIKILLGDLKPDMGTIQQATNKVMYIDQEYSLIDKSRSVYEQTMKYNDAALHEHEIKIRLDRFLFGKNCWDKTCGTLSGGEKMRLILCCLTIRNQAPDIIVLDEPTNNLDIQNIEIITAALNTYKGTLLVISHDWHFVNQIGVEREIELD